MQHLNLEDSSRALCGLFHISPNAPGSIVDGGCAAERQRYLWVKETVQLDEMECP